MRLQKKIAFSLNEEEADVVKRLSKMYQASAGVLAKRLLLMEADLKGIKFLDKNKTNT